MSMRIRLSTTSMTRSSLARSSSVSLVLPLASPQKPAIRYTLRRAQSSIPVVEYCAVSSDFSSDQNNTSTTTTTTTINAHPHKGYLQRLESAANNGDGDLDSHAGSGDYTSCNSSIADLFDILDEPQRVSKDILRSVSLSFQWLNVPFQDADLPACLENPMDTVSEQISEQMSLRSAQMNDSNTGYGMVVSKGIGRGRLPGPGASGYRVAYIFECRTGRSLESHVELRTAMDSLQHWTVQRPEHCCLSYRHDTKGVVATLPWPDLEAGGVEEIEEFVRAVNCAEGIPVFFPRYKPSFVESMKSLTSVPPSSETAAQS